MPVLGTKLHVPRPRRQLVSRPRLTDRLPTDPILMPRLVLVSAPAGFGKTTVLTQWLATGGPNRSSNRPRVAWLSLDRDDSEPTRFLAHVIAALQTTNPDIGVDALRLMALDREPATNEVLVSLVNDLDACADATVLALDDYHVIEGPSVHEAVAFLLDNLPGQVTVAMTTRADPPLPLSRLRARGELVELRAADLRFTEEEAAQFLNDIMGLGLEPRQVAALETRTEGWAAGLQLAALSARGRSEAGAVEDFVDDFSGSHRFVLDYLVEEVLRSQPDDVRAFLLETSVLDELTGPLCDAVTGRVDSQELLEVLDRSNLFLVPLDDRRRWFRYHHLFGDALSAQLAAAGPDRPAELHRAAAEWYAAEGRFADAIAHALAAGDSGAAAELVELAIPQIRLHRDDRDLRVWLRELPEEVVARRPLLATFMGWVRLSEGDLDAAVAWLDSAEKALAAGADVEHDNAHEPRGVTAPRSAIRARDRERRLVPATIEIYRASIAQGRGDLRGTVEHATRAGELSGPQDHLARSGAAGFLALAAWAEGDLETALTTFGECVRHLHESGDIADELGATVVTAGLWLGRGRPDEARRCFESALRTAEAHPDLVLSTTGDLHVGLADVLREQGDLDEAARHLEAARELGDRASLVENRFRWYAVMAGLLRARGDLDAAIAMLQRAQSMYLPGFFPDTRPIAAALAGLHIAAGQLAMAWEWARSRGLSVDTEPAYLAELDLLTLCRLLLAQYRADGDPAVLDDAERVLDRLLSSAQAAARGGSVIEVRLVRALVHRARGDLAAARNDLSDALTAGVPAGYVRLFLDESPEVDEVLRAVAAADLPGTPHAAVVLRAPSPARSDELAPLSGSPGAGVPDGRLSDRELDVLRLLASELTGPEIARRLFVSVNTLRSHTKHIFTKLDVNTRRAAVRKATDLGLL